VGRDPDPLSSSTSTEPSHPATPHTGNRFDSPTAEYGVRYFSTTLDGCYGETLARFRADSTLTAVIGDEWSAMGFMSIGELPADWRQRRTAVQVRFPTDSTATTGPVFLDIESMKTREALRPDFQPLLAHYGYSDLDVPVVRGHDRRITRYISQWTYEQLNEQNQPIYAGIRYLSRLNTDWECWAVFDHVTIEELTRRPILRSDESLARIAHLYQLVVF
jgi:hypothetical protein